MIEKNGNWWCLKVLANREEQIRQLADEARNKLHNMPSFDMLLAEAIQRRLVQSYDDARELNCRFNRTGDFLAPKVLPEFVSECMKGSSGLKILDPWARIGEFIDPVAIALKAEQAIGISSEVNEIGTSLNSYPNTIFIHEDPMSVMDKLESNFDVVLSCIPFNLGPADKNKYVFNNNSLKIKGPIPDLLMVKALSLLGENGLGFCVVTPNFFSGPIPKFLTELNLYIDSAIYLPFGTFSPFTHIATYLIIVSHIRQERLFMGELSTTSHIKTLIGNWKKRISGKALPLGTLIDDFKHYPMLVNDNEIKRLARLASLSSLSLDSIALEINHSNRSLENGFIEKQNSIYLPITGASDCTSILSDLKIKPHHYLQIVLNPGKANSDYVARYFNTDLGKLIRKSALSGACIPKISKTSLNHVELYLPSYNDQINVVEIQNEIDEKRSQLADLEKQLWARPLERKKVKQILTTINKQESFNDWIERIPFPLASILRLYEANNDPRVKKDQLLNFFEGLTEFIVMILLSGSRNNQDYYEEQRNTLKKSLQADSLEKSTFGSWHYLGEQLAKAIRRELSSNKRDLLLQMYRIKQIDFLETLSSKSLHEVLNNVLIYRNNWKGHGGIEASSASEERLVLLQTQLTKIRSILGNCFDNNMLIQPLTNEYSSGVYIYTVQSLMGAYTIFKKIVINTTIPLDINKLYWVNHEHLQPLDLIPIVRFMSSPTDEENACYFYNRFEKDSIRWISYHFERQSEIIKTDEELKDFITSFFC